MFTAVYFGNDFKRALATGDNYEEVYNNAYFEWAMILDYEGFFKVMPKDDANKWLN